MKNILTSFFLLFIVTTVVAQAPLSIPYQAAARNSGGIVLASTSISVRFTIRDSSTSGTIIYRETHTTTTDANGLFSVNVGQGTPVTGTFAGIKWATNAKFLQVELDPAGGSSYIDMGTQQMMSVPFALNAGSIKVTVSTTGDTMHSGNGNFVIIPGISAANCFVTAGTITGTATAVVGSTTTLSNTTAGGTWSSSAAGIATVGSTGIVTAVSAGTATISYRVTVPCGSAIATQVVTVSALTIGMSYAGGKVAYILQPGDPGYIAGESHGLIAAPSDLNSGIQWHNDTSINVGTTSFEIGTGMANTNTIVAAQGSGDYAAKICADLVLGGYSDWFLPSRFEMQKLYLNRVTIGGFNTSAFLPTDYWTSSQANTYAAWFCLFVTGDIFNDSKTRLARVRPVRYF